MTTEFTLSAVDLKALIENTRFAVSTEETRYYLNGIYLHHAEGHLLRAVSTDGHRLARSQMDLPAGAETMLAVIIPRKVVGEMSKLIDEFEGEVRLGLTDTRARFSFGSVEVGTKLIDGTFPIINASFLLITQISCRFPLLPSEKRWIVCRRFLLKITFGQTQDQRDDADHFRQQCRCCQCRGNT